jgi:hypothetical protein
MTLGVSSGSKGEIMTKLSSIIAGACLLAGVFVPTVSQAGAILIEKTDWRTMTDVRCDINFSIGSNYYYDWQDLGSWANNTEVHWGIDPSRCSCLGTTCLGDCLYFRDVYNSSGQRIIASKMDNPTLYRDVYVSCQFEINDSCHQDWEYLGDWNGAGDIRLILNGWNGYWDGSCWVGDFLRHQ